LRKSEVRGYICLTFHVNRPTEKEKEREREQGEQTREHDTSTKLETSVPLTTVVM